MQSCHFIVFCYMQFVSLPIEPSIHFLFCAEGHGGAVTPLPIEPHRDIHSLYFTIFSKEGNWLNDKHTLMLLNKICTRPRNLFQQMNRHTPPLAIFSPLSHVSLAAGGVQQLFGCRLILFVVSSGPHVVPGRACRCLPAFDFEHVPPLRQQTLVENDMCQP